MSNNIQANENLLIVDQRFQAWTATIAVSESDNLYKKKLSSALLKNGRKAIFPGKELKVFDTIKRRSDRYLDKVGIKMLGMHVIPESREAEVFHELQKYEAQWQDAIAELKAKYDQAFAAWLEDEVRVEDAEWADHLPAYKLDAVDACARFKTETYSFRIEPVGAAAEATKKLLDGLDGQALAAVHDYAKEFCEAQQLYTKDDISLSTRNKSTLRDLIKKTSSFTFLNRELVPVLDILNEMYKVFDAASGEVEGYDAIKLKSAYLTLASEDALKAIIEQGGAPLEAMVGISQQHSPDADPDEVLSSIFDSAAEPAPTKSAKKAQPAEPVDDPFAAIFG